MHPPRPNRPRSAARPLRRAILLLLSLGCPAVAAADAPRFGVQEIALTASRVYDGASGSPNPFTQVPLAADVVAPSGKRYVVTGFFDGNGAGGMIGSVFKIRISPDELGTWSWSAASSDPRLDGAAGTFRCTGTLAGRFGAGPVEIDPLRPRFFRQRTGAPIFLLGKFLDHAAPSVALRYSHTFWADQRTDAQREAMLSRHLGMGLNKMNVYVANRGDYGGVATTPWLGTAGSPRRDRFDLARWHRYEKWLKRLQAAGMVAHLWFFADDSGFGDLPETVRKDLIRYGMARLSASPNTAFTVMLEWQEGWTQTEVYQHATFLSGENPWKRLVTVHGTPGDFSFPTASWASFMDLQAGNSASPDTVRTIGLRNRAKANKPLLQEEHGLGTEDTANRTRAWAAYFSGAAGIGSGAYLKHLGAFVAQVGFQDLAPVEGLVKVGKAWVLAKPGVSYAVYAPAGGSLRLDLTGAAGSYDARWLDPRSGQWTTPVVVAGGALRDFAPPGAGDWALHLRRR